VHHFSNEIFELSKSFPKKKAVFLTLKQEEVQEVFNNFSLIEKRISKTFFIVN
jgi:hypothetical protein